MYFNRFGIVSAYYLYFSLFHSGQSSSEYQRMSKMLKYFTPSPMFSVDSLSESGKDILRNLIENKEKINPLDLDDELFYSLYPENEYPQYYEESEEN